MLTLTRKRGQSIILEKMKCDSCAPDGTKIQIVALGVQGTDQKLGVDAPAQFLIRREDTKGIYNKNKQLDLFDKE